MLFPTLTFGIFFLVVLVVSWSWISLPRLRLAFLVAASYVFYGWWDWRFLALLIASTTLNYAAGALVYAATSPTWRKAIVAAGVAVNLVILGVFKYFNFFAASLNDLLYSLGAPYELPFLGIALPIGISFFTFHGISYVVDIYRGQLRTPATFLEMLLYISFFPQLVAGPIVRAAHFLPQLRNPVDPHSVAATRAFLLIIGGLFKKVVVATYLAADLVDPVFFDPTRYGAADLLLATYGYALQIYCDFSAYTDIAIGIAALLGYRFPQNFDQPYRALGLRDFWRRWHISLSSWLRDYLYIPLGGNAGGVWRQRRNLMLTMVLGGLWHGAAWNFVIWGTAHGGALVIEHMARGRLAPRWTAWRGWPVLAVLLTFHFVCLTWIFFRSVDLEHAGQFLAGFARVATAPTQATPFVLALLIGMMLTQFLPADRVERVERWLRSVPLLAQGALVGLAIVIIDSLGPPGVAPFIYFRF